MSHAVQFLSRSTRCETGGGMLIGGPQVRPSSVERFTRTVGELTSGRSGSDEINQTPWAAS